MHILIVFLMLLFSGSAMAQDVVQETALCDVLDAHHPDDGVAYKAGVDVHGNSVVPADLNDVHGSNILPGTIKIPFTVNLAEKFGIQDQFTEDSLNAPLGIIEVTRNGKVTYNGQDLTHQAKVYCSPESLGQNHGQGE
jgi:hypothetical protein